MITGLEVAGLVLAAFPTALDVIRYYQNQLKEFSWGLNAEIETEKTILQTLYSKQTSIRTRKYEGAELPRDTATEKCSRISNTGKWILPTEPWVSQASSGSGALRDRIVAHYGMTGVGKASMINPFISKSIQSRTGRLLSVKSINKRQWEIGGYIDGIKIGAFPDTGSDLDILSATFVKRHNLTIKRTPPRQIKLPTGRGMEILGTIELPFRFEGEKTDYHRTFTVVQDCIHDVILGSPFLEMTKSLSDNFHRRVQESVVAAWKRVPSICLMNPSRQRLLGSLNGIPIDAFPDTGSDVIVISKSAAERMGLLIEMDDEHRTFLEFADGSTHYTDGMVLGAEWRFGSHYEWGRGTKCDIHVLDGLSCDFILSNEFLFDNQVFVKHRECFYEMEMGGEDQMDIWESESHETARLLLIRERQKLKSVLGRLKGLFRSKTLDLEALDLEALDPVVRRKIEEDKELRRQGDEEDRIERLPINQQPAAWKAEQKLRAEWLQNHPPLSSISSNITGSAITLSMPIPATSPNAPVIVASPGNPSIPQPLPSDPPGRVGTCAAPSALSATGIPIPGDFA